MRRKDLGDLGNSFFFSRLSSGRSQNQDLTGLDSGSGLQQPFRRRCRRRRDVRPERARQAWRQRARGELGYKPVPSGRPVARGDNAGVMLDQVIDDGKSSLDAGGIAGDAVLDGRVEVPARTRTRLPSTSISRTVFLVKAMCIYLSNRMRSCDIMTTIKRARPRAGSLEAAPLLDAYQESEMKPSATRRRTSRSAMVRTISGEV